MIAITGPSGVGKTDTSWSMLEHLAKQNISAVLMDADWYANIRPFDWSTEEDVLFVVDQIKAISTQHWDRKTEVLIIPHCYELALQFQSYATFCSENSADLHRLCLLSDIDILKQRISDRVRNKKQKSAELNNAESFLKLFEKQSSNASLGEVLNNSYFTQSETALEILKKTEL